MFALPSKSNCNAKVLVAFVLLLALGLASPVSMYASDKKKKKADTPQPAETPKLDIDPSKLVWPNPPNIARVRWLSYYAGMKIDSHSARSHQEEAELDGSGGRRQAGR
jgi:hypothetical protein